LLAFLRNGVIVAAIASIFLFWNSSHDSEQIVLAILVALVIFNCVPIILTVAVDLISRRHKSSPRGTLPLQTESVKTEAVSLKYRIIALTIIAAVVSLFAGVAIFLASFTHLYFQVPWAIQPATHLAYVLIALGVLPVVAFLSFIAGTYYQGELRGNGPFHWFFRRIASPSNYWPTAA